MKILDAIFPVFALLILGLFLKRFHFTSNRFLSVSDRLVYYILFPAMLFWKIGSTGSGLGAQDFRLFTAVALSVFIAWILSLIFIKIFSIEHFKAGTFSQAAFRFNSYIGMAIVVNTIGEEGIRHFGILIGFIIPLINILSVITLIRYGPGKKKAGGNISMAARALFSNPLILGCAAGIVFSRTTWIFPSFIDNTFQLLASATMPLALISIGGSLRIADSGPDLRLAFYATAIKLIFLPLIGIFCLKMIGVSGTFFAVGLIYLTLPTSPSIFVLSSQMGSDTRLASTVVLISTVLSILSLALALGISF